MILTRNAVHLAAQAYDNVSERAVVHIKAAFEKDPARVYAERVALLDMVIEHSAAEIVRRGNRVHIACEVKVDVLHRENLSVAAAGCAALDAEYGSERRLSEGNYGLFADFCHSLTQTCGCGCLSLTGRSRIDGSYQNQLAVGICAYTRTELIRKLCLVFSVKFKFVLRNADLRRNFLDRQQLSLLSNFNIRQHKMHLRKVFHFIITKSGNNIILICKIGL